MIRYPATPDQLAADVRAIDARWHKKAADRTARFIAAGQYAEKAAIWSIVKPVFMRLQYGKCVFCEQKLENGLYGSIAHDLEHFRPKSSVALWPDPQRHSQSYRFPTGDHSPNGYFWLAYDLGNYAASCKACNSALKSNCFPIGGVRATKPSHKLGDEKPFLCYPIGASDDDPETLISFVATTAVPAARSGFKRRRAQVIIDFFDLNARETLHQQRALMIVMQGHALANIADGTATHANLAADRALVERCIAGNLPHAACSRAFHALWQRDESEARAIHLKCNQYLGSVDS